MTSTKDICARNHPSIPLKLFVHERRCQRCFSNPRVTVIYLVLRTGCSQDHLEDPSGSAMVIWGTKLSPRTLMSSRHNWVVPSFLRSSLIMCIATYTGRSRPI